MDLGQTNHHPGQDRCTLTVNFIEDHVTDLRYPGLGKSRVRVEIEENLGDGDQDLSIERIVQLRFAGVCKDGP